MATRNRNRFDYDLVIIGGGSAGIVAGNVAGALGARVALVEKHRIGGECLWTGCVPSKALLHVGDVARQVRNADALGLKGTAALGAGDCAGAFRYVREKIEEVRRNDASEQMLRDFGVEIFFAGDARFVGPHLLRTAAGDLRGAHFSSPPVRPLACPTSPAWPRRASRRTRRCTISIAFPARSLRWAAAGSASRWPRRWPDSGRR
jgi:choline dehydrogenase-like flavoprotein